jgi:hypothetical protein
VHEKAGFRQSRSAGRWQIILVVYKSSQVIRQRRASSPGANGAGEMAEPETRALFGKQSADGFYQ